MNQRHDMANLALWEELADASLKRWYLQYRLSHLTEIQTADDESNEHDLTDGLVFDTDGPLEPYSELPLSEGEVRLIDCSLAPGTIDPVHLICIEINLASKMTTILVASPFLDPASLYELRLIQPDYGFDTVQCWHLLRVPLVTLEKSWRIGCLCDEDLINCRRLASHSIMGTIPSVDLLEHCGPPITNPLDPRRTYLRDQSKRLQYFQTVAAEIYFDDMTEDSEELVETLHDQAKIISILPELEKKRTEGRKKVAGDARKNLPVKLQFQGPDGVRLHVQALERKLHFTLVGLSGEARLQTSTGSLLGNFDDHGLLTVHMDHYSPEELQSLVIVSNNTPITFTLIHIQNENSRD